MLKILYAAGNSSNSKIQLVRFLEAIQDYNLIIKIAAYKNSSPVNLNIDWTLDSLKDIFGTDKIIIDNENFSIYYDWIKEYSPDLIISDMEYFTCYIANLLNINLWQCNSTLLNCAIDSHDKYKTGLYKKHSYILSKHPTSSNKLYNALIDNASYNFIYSHFGDLNNPPKIKNNFDWIRPYHKIGHLSKPCHHNIVGVSGNSNKNILNLLSNYDDSIAFTERYLEKYKNLLVKDINNFEEYYCNLYNSNVFVCEGQANFLADAFYNKKPSIIVINFEDPECIINGIFSESLGTSHISHNVDNLLTLPDQEIFTEYNPNVKYLHEKIQDL